MEVFGDFEKAVRTQWWGQFGFSSGKSHTHTHTVGNTYRYTLFYCASLYSTSQMLLFSSPNRKQALHEQKDDDSIY